MNNIRGWTTTKVVEVASKMRAGGTPNRSNHNYWQGEIPFVLIEDMTKTERFLIETKECISRLGLRSSSAWMVPENSILLSMYATLGKVIINKIPVATNQAILGIIPAKVDRDFLYYLLQFSADRLSKLNSQTTQKNLNKQIVSNFEITYPVEPAEQRAIADILTTVDDAIEQTEALIHKYQRIKQGLMQDLLTRGVDENGELRPKAELAPLIYRQNNDQWIPNEWTIKTIENLSIYVGSGITPKGGSEVYGSEGVMFVRSQNVTFEGLLLNDVAYIDDKIHRSMCRSEIFPYDVLINITGASIGRCCVFPEGLGKANVNQHVCAIRFASPDYYDANYLSYVLSSWIGQLQIDKLNAGGNRQGLNYQQLRSFQLPWPEKNERKIIVDILKRNDELITIEKNNHLKLLALKQGLMQDLLTGKVCVYYE